MHLGFANASCGLSPGQVRSEHSLTQSVRPSNVAKCSSSWQGGLLYLAITNGTRNKSLHMGHALKDIRQHQNSCSETFSSQYPFCVRWTKVSKFWQTNFLTVFGWCLKNLMSWTSTWYSICIFGAARLLSCRWDLSLTATQLLYTWHEDTWSTNYIITSRNL